MANIAPKITYPQILTTAAWKKAKGLFTLNTGVSQTLRDCEAAFKTASNDIAGINAYYEGDIKYIRPREFNMLEKDLERLVKSASSGPLNNFKKELWAVRDHAKQIAAGKTISSKAKALLLDMAQTADLQAVAINSSSVGGYLKKVLDTQEKALNETLALLFGPDNLNKRIKDAENFIRKIRGIKDPAKQVEEFNDDCVTTFRNITQIVGNRAKSQEKLGITLPNAGLADQVFRGLTPWADKYDSSKTTPQNLRVQLDTLERWVREAAKLGSGRVPTVREIAA